MEVEVKSKIGAEYDGKRWFITINDHRIGPSMRSQSTVKVFRGWLERGGMQDIAKEWSVELEK